jgi:hypothetical protein
MQNKIAKNNNRKIINSSNSFSVDIINNNTNYTQSNNNSEEFHKEINTELQNIKTREKNNQILYNKQNIIPKIEIPQINKNFFCDDSDNLIDLSNEIEMITDELKETYYDDILNENNMSLLQIKALIGSFIIYLIEGLHVSLTG